MRHGTVTAEFHELGLGEPVAISSAHGDGVRELVDELLDRARRRRHRSTRTTSREPIDDGPRRIKIAIVGRPNVGKSTLVNTLLGEERVIVFDMPGTTRDSIHIDFDRERQAVHADRHRRPAPARQGVRGGREVLGRQDAAVGRRRQRRRARARRAPGDLGPGRAHRRLRRRVGPCAWSWRSTSGTASTDYERERIKRDAARKLQFLVVREDPLHLGAEGAGPRRGDEVGRRRRRGGVHEAADAEAHARAGRGGRQADAAATRHRRARSCATRTRAARTRR